VNLKLIKILLLADPSPEMCIGFTKSSTCRASVAAAYRSRLNLKRTLRCGLTWQEV